MKFVRVLSVLLLGVCASGGSLVSFRSIWQQRIQRVISSVGLIFVSSAAIANDETVLSTEISSEIKKIIQSGQAYYLPNFISPEFVKKLRIETDEQIKKGLFKPSGLSNRTVKDNKFNNKDRQIAPLVLNESGSSEILVDVHSKLKKLRFELSDILDRQSMKENVDHETYLSLGKVGTLLPRHVDERHEETKGRLGWLSNSRRSISWLIYLSFPDEWTTSYGGALRTYPQNIRVQLDSTNQCGSHQGNLQIGWLRSIDCVQPVYLNCWILDDDEYKSALYIRKNNETIYITRNFDIKKSNGNYEEFFINQNLGASKFYKIEEYEKWKMDSPPSGSTTMDFLPVAGSLILFDSVSLPHQVQEVLAGSRIALAGWFHERQAVPM